MSLSDRFKSLVNKKDSSSSKPEKKEIPTPPESKPTNPPAPAPASHTLEDLGKLISQERAEGETKKQALDKELHEIRSSLEKMDSSSKSSRDTRCKSPPDERLGQSGFLKKQ